MNSHIFLGTKTIPLHGFRYLDHSGIKSVVDTHLSKNIHYLFNSNRTLQEKIILLAMYVHGGNDLSKIDETVNLESEWKNLWKEQKKVELIQELNVKENEISKIQENLSFILDQLERIRKVQENNTPEQIQINPEEKSLESLRELQIHKGEDITNTEYKLQRIRTNREFKTLCERRSKNHIEDYVAGKKVQREKELKLVQLELKYKQTELECIQEKLKNLF